MRYSFLLYSKPEDFVGMTPEEGAAMQSAFGAYIGALNEAGVFVATDWLQPVDTATTLFSENGEERIQDGPFAETKETLGGVFIIDVPDLDAALAWARKCPMAQYGKIEIRPSAMPS